MLVRWFVVLPLKGEPAAEGFVPEALFIFTGFHLAFGLGLGALYSAGKRIFRAPSIENKRLVRS
jgi:hypothetical protein